LSKAWVKANISLKFRCPDNWIGQGALTRVKHLLEEEVDALGLEQGDVSGLLARLCMVRSFWRYSMQSLNPEP